MSKSLSALLQKRPQRKFIDRFTIDEVDIKVTNQSEIELAPSGFETSSNVSSSIEGLKKKISIWFKEYILSTSYFLFSVLTFVLLPEGKTEKGLGAYYLDRAEKFLKRVIDIAGSTIGLVISLPLFFVVGILIKLDSPGPVFFRQERVGMNRRKRDRRFLEIKRNKEERKTERRKKNLYGESFYLYKFRTMVADAEKGCGPIWAKNDDPRITKIGKVLRKIRLDELPQLINVLKGEMSLVGPRPERYHFVRDFIYRIDGYPNRLGVKPGITGLAQVENGYDSCEEDVKLKVNHDLNYIQQWSILKDFKILLKTILVVATGKGAC
ncbi:MAG TPA: sugar transferase [Terriglobales bacterium]|nr:sugar transferase [Terriglobales bacterium]